MLARTPRHNVDAKAPKPPKWLTAHGRDEWKRVAGALAQRGSMAPEIYGIVASYCSEIGNIRQCSETIAREGDTVDTARGGSRMHPSVTSRSRSASIALQLAKQLNLFGVGGHVAADDYDDLGVR